MGSQFLQFLPLVLPKLTIFFKTSTTNLIFYKSAEAADSSISSALKRMIEKASNDIKKRRENNSSSGNLATLSTEASLTLKPATCDRCDQESKSCTCQNSNCKFRNRLLFFDIFFLLAYPNKNQTLSASSTSTSDHLHPSKNIRPKKKFLLSARAADGASQWDFISRFLGVAGYKSEKI